MKNTLTLLHTADLHLGAAFSGLGPRGVQQRQRLREVLNDILDVVRQEKVQVVLLAGDTFDHGRPSPESITAFSTFVQQLYTLGVPVVLIAGTHDHWAQNDLFPKLQRALGEALVVLSPEEPVWTHTLLGLRVQGVSLVRQDEPEHPLSLIQRDSQFSGWQVGMAHAALDLGKAKTVEARFSLADIAATGMDYLALGHWHGQQEYSSGPVTAWYSGAPEMIALDETQSGQVLLVTLQDGQPVRVIPRQVGKRSWVHVDVESTSVDAVMEKVKNVVSPDTVLDLSLNGIIGPEQAPLKEDLERRLAPLFFYVRIHDRTRAEYSEDDLNQYPDSTALGRFIRLMQADIAGASEPRRSELQKALQLGVAYLRGTEVALWS